MILHIRSKTWGRILGLLRSLDDEYGMPEDLPEMLAEVERDNPAYRRAVVLAAKREHKKKLRATIDGRKWIRENEGRLVRPNDAPLCVMQVKGPHREWWSFGLPQCVFLVLEADPNDIFRTSRMPGKSFVCVPSVVTLLTEEEARTVLLTARQYL